MSLHRDKVEQVVLTCFVDAPVAEAVQAEDHDVGSYEGIHVIDRFPDAQSQFLIKELSDSYDGITSWSALFDTTSMDAKKMIVNTMITRIDVFKGNRLNVEFSFSLRQFFFGLNDTVEIPAPLTA